MGLLESSDVAESLEPLLSQTEVVTLEASWRLVKASENL